MLCKAKKKNREPCKAPAVGKNGYCFFHDPDREDERQAAREKGANTSPRKVVILAADVDLATVENVRGVLSAMLREVLDTTTSRFFDIGRKARAAGYLGRIILDSLKESETDERLAALEARAGITDNVKK